MIQLDAAQTFSGRASNDGGIIRGGGKGEVTRQSAKVVKPQFDADRAADVTLALEVFRHARAKVGKDLGQDRAIMASVKVFFEGAFTAKRFGF